jgi:hypothetical protein
MWTDLVDLSTEILFVAVQSEETSSQLNLLLRNELQTTVEREATRMELHTKRSPNNWEQRWGFPSCSCSSAFQLTRWASTHPVVMRRGAKSCCSDGFSTDGNLSAQYFWWFKLSVNERQFVKLNFLGQMWSPWIQRNPPQGVTQQSDAASSRLPSALKLRWPQSFIYFLSLEAPAEASDLTQKVLRGYPDFPSKSSCVIAAQI